MYETNTTRSDVSVYHHHIVNEQWALEGLTFSIIAIVHILMKNDSSAIQRNRYSSADIGNKLDSTGTNRIDAQDARGKLYMPGE